MELLTAELRAQLPGLYAQEHVSDPIVYAKFFTPDSSWTWFVTEGQPDGDDFRFFGYVVVRREFRDVGTSINEILKRIEELLRKGPTAT